MNRKEIWEQFTSRHSVLAKSVPLFLVCPDGKVSTRLIGRDVPRSVLERSGAMESLIRSEVDKLVAGWKSGKAELDGLIYMIFRTDKEAIIPLYIGKAETLGKGDRNLSANLVRLETDTSKFARWGDNYQYHIGDLSAVALPGHDPKHKSEKYTDWANALFREVPSAHPELKLEVRFWTKAWSREDVGIWEEFGQTGLAFLEYLMIGVASSLFPDQLLNREGQNR